MVAKAGADRPRIGAVDGRSPPGIAFSPVVNWPPSVSPGFGGRPFLESQLPKIAAPRRMIDKTGRGTALEAAGTPAVAVLRGEGA